MKSRSVTIFSLLLVFALLFGTSGSVKAAVGDDPVVTPVSGDKEFTTEVIPIASLPGTIELASLMLAPAGFPEGEAQFEGAGVLVTKFDAGKATACFTISGTQYGWGGKVGMWNGTKWVLLPTTIKTTGDDGTSTTACTTITGNGTYAFIKYVVDPSLLPQMQECNFDFQIWVMNYQGSFTPSGSGYTAPISGMWFITSENIDGLHITVQFLYTDPATDNEGAPIVAFEGPVSGIADYFVDSYYYIGLSPYINYFQTWDYHTYSEFYRVTIGNCYVITERVVVDY
jgi:hypothetical protein